MKENDNINEINLAEVLSILLDRKIFIGSFIILFGILSLFIALSIPNIYTSSALLNPSKTDESLSGKLGSYSAIAGFAGFSLPSDGGTDSQEAMARIKSYDFFVNEFLPNIKLANLIAAEDWEIESNTIKYNKKLFDDTKNKWVRKANFPYGPKPSDQEAYEEYLKKLFVSEDKITQFVTLSFEHYSPYVAQKWVELSVEKINNYMRNIDQELARNSINFLEEISSQTNLTQVKDTISVLLKQQLETLMLTESSDNYVYEYIETPLAPEKKSRPSRAIICILITAFGGFLGSFISLVMHYRKS